MNNFDRQGYVYLERQKWEQNTNDAIDLRKTPKLMPKPKRISAELRRKYESGSTTEDVVL